MAKLLITYRKSTIGYSEDQKRTVQSLGLRKLNQKVLQPDNAAVRGMVFKVQHLLTVEEVADDYSIPVREPWPRPRVIGRVDGAATTPGASVAAMRVTTTLAAEEPEVVASAEADDLEIIEGIGPKIAGLLRENGITTFAELAATSPATLEEILQAANLRLADASTWAEQASLAADGKWDELRALQDRLQGGRVVE